ncbi:hypothetical protein RCZ04_16760 [Capnocytophaga sp. HP1101]
MEVSKLANERKNERKETEEFGKGFLGKRQKVKGEMGMVSLYKAYTNLIRILDD